MMNNSPEKEKTENINKGGGTFFHLKKLTFGGVLLLIVAIITTFAVGFASWLIIGNNLYGTEGGFIAYDVSEPKALNLTSSEITVSSDAFNQYGFWKESSDTLSADDGTTKKYDLTDLYGSFYLTLDYTLDLDIAYENNYISSVTSSNTGTVNLCSVLSQTGDDTVFDSSFVTVSGAFSSESTGVTITDTTTAGETTTDGGTVVSASFSDVPTSGKITFTLTYTITFSKSITYSEFKTIFDGLFTEESDGTFAAKSVFTAKTGLLKNGSTAGEMGSAFSSQN